MNPRDPEAFQGLDEKYERLPLAQIVASKTNPRTHFPEGYIAQLAESLREKGLIEPIIVRPSLVFPCGHQLGAAYSSEALELWNILSDPRTQSSLTRPGSSTAKGRSTSAPEAIASGAMSPRQRATTESPSFDGSEKPGSSARSTANESGSPQRSTIAGSGLSTARESLNTSLRFVCPSCASNGHGPQKPSSSSRSGSPVPHEQSGRQAKTDTSESTSTISTLPSLDTSGDQPPVSPLVASPSASSGVAARSIAAVYSIVAGECRFRAGKHAGLSHLPAIIRAYSDEQVLELQLIENLHRKDLTPLEQARGYRRLIDANPDKHSAETIATRIGMSPAWVWDRMKLNDLVPEAKTILEQERMTVGHAILIARLKPADQERVIAVEDGRNGYHSQRDGLWQFNGGGLDWDEDAPENAKRKPGKYDRVKAVSVRELETWIHDHIRFDIAHAAKAVPLEFEPTAAAVAAAEERPGRGKKFIPITFSYRVADDARDPNERTYGHESWERADGQEKSKTCEHSVLGVVVAGSAQYGQTFEVCVARDKCRVHFGKVIAAKEKVAKLRESGKSKQAVQTEKRAEQSWERDNRLREEERRRWAAVEPHALAAVLAKIKPAKVTDKVCQRVIDMLDCDQKALLKHLGGRVTVKNFTRALDMADAMESRYSRSRFVPIAKKYGVDLAKLEKELQASGAKDAK